MTQKTLSILVRHTSAEQKLFRHFLRVMEREKINDNGPPVVISSDEATTQIPLKWKWSGSSPTFFYSSSPFRHLSRWLTVLEQSKEALPAFAGIFPTARQLSDRMATLTSNWFNVYFIFVALAPQY